MEFRGFTVINMGGRNWCYNDGVDMYDFGDIEKCDAIVDIGACFGAFSLNASGLSDAKITCVEPVWSEVAGRNFIANDINALVIPALLSDKGGDEFWVEWNGNVAMAPTITMQDLLKPYSGKKIFVKCDCEGAEWNLVPSDFKDIARLEIEFHLLKQGSPTAKPVNQELVEFLEKEYYVFPHPRQGRDNNGIARVFHLYKKRLYPKKEKEDGQGPLVI